MTPVRSALTLLLIVFGITFNHSYSQVIDSARWIRCTNCDDQLDLAVVDTSVSYTYESDTLQYSAQLVADDFGPRKPNSDRYDWHGGIDFNGGEYNADMGDLILAINGGQVTGKLTSDYRRLIIRNNNYTYGYGHMFDNGNTPQRSGDCWLLQMVEDEYNCILCTVNGDTTAIGPDTGRVVFNGNLYPVGNQVEQNDVIGPTGESGISGGAHLHLFGHPGNSNSVHDTVTLNPLNRVYHLKGEFELELRRITNYLANQSIDWAGPNYGSSYSNLVVRPVLQSNFNDNNRYDSIPSIDSVYLKISPDGSSDFEFISGLNHEAIICLGGAIDNTRYPEYIWRDASTVGDPGDNLGDRIGTLTRQGIRPFLHATNGAQRYDDYYFTDFQTRINNAKDDLAECPGNALYNDGKYQLLAVAKTINGDIFQDTTDFVIDNFKPFIQSVQADFNQKVIYDFEWICGEGECEGIKPLGGYPTGDTLFQADIDSGLLVVVQTSEPLADLSMIFEENCSDDNCFSINTNGVPSSDRTSWTFEINDLSEFIDEGVTSPNGGEFKFLFSGHDYGPDGEPGNELLQLSSFFNPGADFGTGQSDTICVALPHRTSLTSWSNNDIPQGIDSTHYLLFECGFSGEEALNTNAITYACCDLSEETVKFELYHAFDENCEDGAIDVTITGGIPPFQVTYTDIDGNVLQQNEVPNGTSALADLLDISRGEYVIVVQDIACTHQDTIVIEGELSVNITKSERESCDEGDVCSGAIALDITSYQDNYNIQWNNGEMNVESIDSLCSGTYTYEIYNPDRSCSLSGPNIDINNFCCLEILEHFTYLFTNPVNNETVIHLGLSVNQPWVQVSEVYVNDTLIDDPNEFPNFVHGGFVQIGDYSFEPNQEYTIEIFDFDGCSTKKVIYVNECAPEDVDDKVNFQILQHDLGDGDGSFQITYDDNAVLLHEAIQYLMVFHYGSTPGYDTLFLGNPDETFNPVFSGLDEGVNYSYYIDTNNCRKQVVFFIEDCNEIDYETFIQNTTFTTQHSGDPSDPIVLTVNHPEETGPFTYLWHFGDFPNPDPIETEENHLITDQSGEWVVEIRNACDTSIVIDSPVCLGQCHDGKIKWEVRDKCQRPNNLQDTKFSFDGKIQLGNNFPLCEINDTVGVRIVFDGDDGSSSVLFPQENNPDQFLMVFNPDDNEYNYKILNAGSTHTINNPRGVVTISVTFSNGCVLTEFVRLGHRANFRATVFDPQQVHAEDLLIYQDPTVSNPVIVGMYDCWYCVTEWEAQNYLYINGRGSECDKNEEPSIEYRPHNASTPCTGGGTMRIFGGPGGPQEIAVPPNLTSRTFQEGDRCACLFSYGTVLYDPFLVPTYFDNDPGFRDVYVECTDESDVVVIPDAHCSDFCEPGEPCRVGPSSDDECSLSFYCTDSLGVERERLSNIFPNAGGGIDSMPPEPCYMILEDEFGDEAVLVGIPCASDPCNFNGFNTQVLGGGHFTIGSLEDVATIYLECTVALACTGLQMPEAFGTPVEFVRNDIAEGLRLSVAPNPHSNSTSVTIRILGSDEHSRIETIEVIGLDGQRKIVIGGQAIGAVSVETNLDVVPGLYIVTATTNTGEVLRQKLIVQ